MQWRQQLDPTTATAADLTDFHWVFYVGLCWIFHMGFPLDLVFIDFGLDLEWVFRRVWVAVELGGDSWVVFSWGFSICLLLLC